MKIDATGDDLTISHVFTYYHGKAGMKFKNENLSSTFYKGNDDLILHIKCFIN